jgi:hypothetical protein
MIGGEPLIMADVLLEELERLGVQACDAEWTSIASAFPMAGQPNRIVRVFWQKPT